MSLEAESREIGEAGYGEPIGGSSRERIGLVAALIALVAILHFTTPVGPPGLHKLHLLYQKLFYIPVIMAAAWFGFRGTVASALASSLLLLFMSCGSGRGIRCGRPSRWGRSPASG